MTRFQASSACFDCLFFFKFFSVKQVNFDLILFNDVIRRALSGVVFTLDDEYSMKSYDTSLRGRVLSMQTVYMVFMVTDDESDYIA
jgi:hypothetical protein